MSEAFDSQEEIDRGADAVDARRTASQMSHSCLEVSQYYGILFSPGSRCTHVLF